MDHGRSSGDGRGSGDGRRSDHGRRSGDGRGAAEHSQDGTTPERILAAAAAILGEDGITARLSVRAVAARAEVSIGSLRHHFPTQQALRDEVMRRVYDWMLPESSIEDRAIPARDRLVGCLRGVLDMSGAGAEARSSMITVTSSFIAAEPTEPVREAYLAMQRDGQQRMEQWLRVLAAERAEDEVLAADEGVGDLVAERDIVRDARFLATVLNGLALERALPAEDSLAHAETEALYMAADAVLEPRPPR